jgi:hypothetical protein
MLKGTCCPLNPWLCYARAWIIFIEIYFFSYNSSTFKKIKLLSLATTKLGGKGERLAPPYYKRGLCRYNATSFRLL